MTGERDMTDGRMGMTDAGMSDAGMTDAGMTDMAADGMPGTAGSAAVPDIELVWQGIVEWQGKTLLTKSGLPFTYSVKEKSIFIDRKKKTITKSTIDRALEKMKEQKGTITGPKALGMFGAPYIWAIFTKLGIAEDGKKTEKQED